MHEKTRYQFQFLQKWYKYYCDCPDVFSATVEPALVLLVISVSLARPLMVSVISVACVFVLSMKLVSCK
jgi:hypothetical protein